MTDMEKSDEKVDITKLFDAAHRAAFIESLLMPNDWLCSIHEAGVLDADLKAILLQIIDKATDAEISLEKKNEYRRILDGGKPHMYHRLMLPDLYGLCKLLFPQFSTYTPSSMSLSELKKELENKQTVLELHFHEREDLAKWIRLGSQRIAKHKDRSESLVNDNQEEVLSYLAQGLVKLMRCGICEEATAVGYQICLQNCGHLFCSGCYAEWRLLRAAKALRPICPTCYCDVSFTVEYISALHHLHAVMQVIELEEDDRLRIIKRPSVDAPQSSEEALDQLTPVQRRVYFNEPNSLKGYSVAKVDVLMAIRVVDLHLSREDRLISAYQKLLVSVDSDDACLNRMLCDHETPEERSGLIASALFCGNCKNFGLDVK
ncbi:hypothetical protein GALMADRAFT_148175 [Galerina marginata CBS 339.88]|uniref:RING-type domain-containing protein n=1 Tax=Galerina marginata (strain CBS 339.88) TaxID=685588 RepID=A0A067SGY8_GALM3|nr:hypothetical protein GALMADRAFT_148175 [Galerina marginata CBS 339.88]